MASDPWALVLAGGDGRRLQALTRRLTGRPIPKQYCRLLGDRSMLELTFARLAPLIEPARTLAIVNRDHLPLAADQLRGLPAANVLVQAKNCDTGPGLLFAMAHLQAHAPDATLAVFPSDHYVRDDRGFLAHVAHGLDVVRRFPEQIVLLGVTPDHAGSGFGYLDVGDALSGDDEGVFRVLRFVEKPSAAAAARMIDRGSLWNSFVMLFRLETMLSLLRRWRPADFYAPGARDGAPPAPWNFSRDFLAHVPDALLALRVGDVGWSDWGTPEAIERSLLVLGVVPPWYGPSHAA